MRTSLFLVICLCFTSFSFARPFKTNRSSTKTPSFSKVREKLKGLSLVGSLNTANRLPIKLNSDQFTAKSEASFGFGAEYKMDLRKYAKNSPMNFIGGLIYETPREIKSITTGGEQFEIGGATPSFGMLMAYGNFDYEVTDQAALFGGLNFPFPIESNFDDTSLSGALGFQGGVSMTVSRSFGADIMYQWVNLTGNGGLNRIDVDGLQFRGRYIF